MTRATFSATLLATSATLSQRAFASEPVAFEPWQLEHDLDELWHAMIAVGAYPFATADRRAVTERYRRVRAALTAPSDAASFVLAIAPIFGAMNDGHVGVRPGDGFARELAVPVRCTLVRGETIVLASWNDVVAPGSILVSLAGIDAARIRDLTLAGWGGQTERLRVERFASASRIVATILARDPARYQVRWIDPRGNAEHAVLPRAVVALPWQTGSAWTFRTVARDRIGLIDYRRCVGEGGFEAFLRAVFTRVRAMNIRSMIVDIRNNTGGDSDLNNALWSYLSAKKFSQFGPIGMRASIFLKRLYGKAKYVEIYGIEAWNAPDGTPVTYSQAKIGFIEPGPRPLRFEGRVALLIGPRTFSSALDCALAAKAYGLATLVGEETSEPAATTGELFEMATRYTKTIGSFTTKYFTPPGNLAPGRGVVPDIEVVTTLADTIDGRDPVLERAIRALLDDTR